jgi:S-adenosylmethionine:tRNA ribosyltransferase-isomerase
VRTEDFDFELPAELVAQHPAVPRDSARLMVLDRRTGSIEHSRFDRLPDWLGPPDLLVLNDSRVLPARLRVWKSPSGGRAELLLLRRLGERDWEALAGGPGHRPGSRLKVVGGPWAEVVADLGGARRRVRFETDIEPALGRVGLVPLPPYIREPLRDPEDYQTVYAREAGSAAAPTAGLHFTQELLDRLMRRGVAVAKLTLHVGLDTFQPVTVADPTAHPIHSEWCRVGREVVEAVRRAKAGSGRVIAVGTTAVRALESAAGNSASPNGLAPLEGPTNLFILPGYEFRVIDAMLTNFHLPRSTLIMMVSAFAGRDRLLAAYQVAIREGYRFFSFGDAMLIL